MASGCWRRHRLDRAPFRQDAARCNYLKSFHSCVDPSIWLYRRLHLCDGYVPQFDACFDHVPRGPICSFPLVIGIVTGYFEFIVVIWATRKINYIIIGIAPLLDWESIHPRSFGRFGFARRFFDFASCTVERTWRRVDALYDVGIIWDWNPFENAVNGTIAPVRPLISSPSPPFPRGVHRVEPRLHVRFRLFLAIFIHSRGQIIRERCVELAARSFEREIAFCRGKIWRPAMGEKSGLCFVAATNEWTKSWKHGVENRLERRTGEGIENRFRPIFQLGSPRFYHQITRLSADLIASNCCHAEFHLSIL